MSGSKEVEGLRLALLQTAKLLDALEERVRTLEEREPADGDDPPPRVYLSGKRVNGSE